MPFIDINQIQPNEIVPGVRIRTPHLNHLMLSYVEMDEGAVVPLHNHPHEQGGILLKGKLEFTIGEEVRVVEPGSLFLIPANVSHKVVAVAGPVLVLDVFSPIREDYAALFNKYIPTEAASKTQEPQA